jgi:hypothetical protein
MTFKYKVGIAISALLLSFCLGRYSSNHSDIGRSVQTRSDTVVQDHENVHKVEVITKKPDGDVVETVTTDSIDNKQLTQTVDTKKTVDKTSKINISVLAGTDITKGINLTPVYGFQASKEFIGPVTVGVFGLTSGVVGVSIGIDF